MGRILRLVGLLTIAALLASNANAERISDIRNTKHNFSATVVPSLPGGESRVVQASEESQICAFCHTPHGATQAPRAPLWNRQLSGATYTPYSSTSMEAIDVGQPNAKSKLCLSCHDGTLAIGAVNVLNGVQRPTINMIGTSPDGTIPPGEGGRSGFTRRLGVDLTNDHPISFTYDSAQAVRDGELRDPAVEPHLGERFPGHKPLLPLEDGQMECVTCHDPHLRDASGENIKFLRVNRFQEATPVEGTFDQANDIICLACHEKAGWADSAHANYLVADETYTDAAAKVREFPRDMPVWRAACLNCHDPHTVQGARRLLREGTDDSGQLTADGFRIKQGGNAAIEEACYACHSADGNVLQGQGSTNFQVPNIKTDFTTPGNIHMPIASSDQPAGEERHAIGTATGFAQDGKDFLESPQQMGKGDLSNRHVECTDCHNPHRVTQNRLFWADPRVPDGQGTHNHDLDQIANNPEGYHTNIASGVLRGTWGVEPIYGGTEFTDEPIGFEVKRGDPGVGGSTDVAAPYVTREYQVCLKCHSNYSYDTPPPLGANHSGGTPPGTNALFNYTNQASEYQSPDDHMGEGTAMTPSGVYSASQSSGTCDDIYANNLIGSLKPPQDIPGYIDPAGNCVDFETDNHRAWHPVMKETGRTAVPGGGGVRNADSDDWLPPFNVAVGIQTMYCSDCHGSDTDIGTAVPRGGDLGNVWGPHGSRNHFLLKGPWSDETGQNTPDGLCFKCHNYDYYGRNFPAGPNIQTNQSGFSTASGGGGCLLVPDVNLHTGHAQDGAVQNFRCSYCHVAIPHGWKNKNFLVNLNDVGEEVGLPSRGNQVRNKTTSRYYRGPYYNGAVLKVLSFKKSGEWTHISCGSSGEPGNGLVGGRMPPGNPPAGTEFDPPWMTSIGAGSEACNNLP